MNKSGTPKPQFRILFGGAEGGNPVSIVRKGPKVIRYSNNDEMTLDAAVESINASNTQMKVTPILKSVGRPQKVMTLNNEEKLEKIVFFPKFVKKKVMVVNDRESFGTPTKILQKALTNSDTTTPKRRKLGDLALASWNQVAIKKEEQEPPVEEVKETNDAHLLCRLCGSLVKEDDAINLIDSEKGGITTQVGLKLKAIVSNELPENPSYPNICCKSCASKVKLCFSLLTEIQATHQVAKKTFEEADVDVNPASQMYTCTDCDQEVMGMKEFVEHYENHYMERTLGLDSIKKEVDVDELEESESDDILLELREGLEALPPDDGTTTLITEDGQFMCEFCGKTFEYKFLLQIHRKAPKTAIRADSGNSGICYVCNQHKSNLTKCAIVSGEVLEICSSCRSNVTFMIM